MNKKLVLGIGVSVLLLAILGFTYAYFTTTITGEGADQTVTTGTLSLVYKDGQELTLSGANPGDYIEKTVTVTNTGSLDTGYNITFKNLINTITNNELVISYTCTSYTDYVDANNKGTVSGTCESINEQVVPLSETATDSAITNGIAIASGITHEYQITITFIETGEVQNYNQGKAFSSLINIIGTEEVTLYNVILRDNEAMPDDAINFAQISSDTNGKGLYYTSGDETEDLTGDGQGETVYYYRGAVENNNVTFGGYCWRIVRTNEDGSVRLRYNGTYSDGTCPVTGTDTKIGGQNYVFNSTYNDEKYNEYVRDDGSGDSEIKGTIDTWYETSGLINYAEKLANVPYCGDKTDPTIPEAGSYTKYTFYGASNRLIDFSGTSMDPKEGAQPIFKCNDETHKYTVNGDAWDGNGKLTYPIGMITADEVSYAGGARYLADGSSDNSTYYLYTGAYYWTMSPFGWNGSTASVFTMSTTGYISGDGVYRTTVGVLPVVSLKTDVTVASGTGSYTNPYVVE